MHEGFGDSHLDLFLDLDGNSRLITFGTAASNWDFLQKGSPIEFQRKKDHKRDYLNWEGELDGKGKLKILLRGTAKGRVLPENVSGWNDIKAFIKDGTLMF